ncbi:MAG: hypothetical protein V2A73_20490 [Pseudomonadota bacterium]
MMPDYNSYEELGRVKKIVERTVEYQTETDRGDAHGTDTDLDGDDEDLGCDDE